MSARLRLLDHRDPSLPDLRRHGSAPVLVTDGHRLSYDELADRVDERAAQLGPTRRLVMLGCRNDVETVVTYLAAQQGRHPVLLTDGDVEHPRFGELTNRYEPDVVAAGDTVEERCVGTRHRLHEDLALLMSTSGTTGSPKLVRLSRENLRANADSIATYLSITPDDRAATTLPLHYCYGLSVLNSHLLVGASLLVTERSVVDDEFWDDFRASRATSFAGVPHTFDLLDAAGFATQHLPSLRYVTQAGGRLAPEKVRRYAALGRQRGFDLVVMYGQTEATARMAYLPAHLAEARPEAIGIPVPGGSLRIDTGSVDARDCVGELVYTGPNVMLGYASGPQDLAAGRVVHELRTGDLARQHEDGIFELVGRNSRLAKVFGLRIDLDRVERIAEERGVQARAVEHDGKLVLFVTRHLDLASLDSVAVLCGVPPAGLTRLVVSSFPKTSSGKPDYASLHRHAAVVERSARQGTVLAAPEAANVRDLLAELLGRPDATVEDSFVDLRGDSLSYIEVSVRLGELVGPLPSDWPERSCSELTRAPAQRPPSRPGRWRSGHVETSVALRAAAIFLIVATHANLITVMGGAHLMLGLVGFNLARFQLSGRHRGDRARDLVRAAGQVAVPAGIWILGVGFVTGMYRPATALMLNNLVGSRVWDVQWQFWFLEAAVWSQVLVAGLVLLPWVDTWERRRPYAFAVGVLAVTVTLRYVLVGVVAGPTERYGLPAVLWCIALGWLVARSTTTSTRLATSVLAAGATYGFFDDVVREGLVVAGLLLLTWLQRVAAPHLLRVLATKLAASSLFVYLTHWQVYPHLEMDHPLAATLLSLAVGAGAWRCYRAVDVRLRGWTPRAPWPRGVSAGTSRARPSQ